MSERRTYLDAETHELVYGFDVTRSEKDFDEHQIWMARTLLSHSRLLLGAFMGSGKTAVGLYCIHRLIKRGKIKRALVIAPLKVAEDTWPDELMVWTFGRELSYSVIVGSPEEREKARLEDTELHIVNRENLRWLYGRWGWKHWPYDLIIYDEASRLKGGNFRTKSVQRKDGSWSQPKRSEFAVFRNLASSQKIRGVWEFSGTPAPNGLIDLWGPISAMDGGARLGTSMKAYKARWFAEDKYTYKITPHPHSEAEIMDRCKDIFYCLKEEDYLKDLPPVHVRDRWVRLSPKHEAMYRDFERRMILQEYDIQAVTSGVLCNKLLQFANGSIYDENGDDQFVHDRKVQELDSIVSEAGGRPLMIAYSYQFDLAAIKKRFPKFRIYGEGKNDMRDWNLGRIPGLLIHPASAGHGLNFQHGGNIAVWFGLNWSLELYQQFNKRLHRRGQKEDHVLLYRILAANTNDARVAKALTEKGTTQDRITDTVRVRRDELRRALTT